jgi:hypothetical protein
MKKGRGMRRAKEDEIAHRLLELIEYLGRLKRIW